MGETMGGWLRVRVMNFPPLTLTRIGRVGSVRAKQAKRSFSPESHLCKHCKDGGGTSMYRASARSRITTRGKVCGGKAKFLCD